MERQPSPNQTEEVRAVYRLFEYGIREKLEKAILSLEEQPYREAERKYGFYAFKGYRQLTVENYIIVYEVFENEKVVAVVTIKYGKVSFRIKKSH